MANTPANRWLEVIMAPLVWLIAFILRLIFWWLLHLLYRIRVVGHENIPKKGPALLVCNHVSWLDGLFIVLSMRRRVRFLIWAPFTRVPVLRWLLALGRVIPIDVREGPRAIVKALKEASKVLERGEVVGIFAEGSLTRTGFLLPFHRGFEQIVKNQKEPVPIIPTTLDRLWGSIFSYQRGKMLWKWPQRLPYPVTVMFGKPMPGDSKAWQVRLAVQKQLADCFNLRTTTHKPAHRQFVRMACRHPFRKCLIDPTPNGKKLRYGETLTASIMLANLLRGKFHDAPMVGLYLPTTVGGVIANIAVALLGKTAVNLNYTASKESIHSAIKQCGIRHVVTAKQFMKKMNFDFGSDVELIQLEDLMGQITKFRRVWTYLRVLLFPGWVTERLWLGLGGHRSSDIATVIFSSGSTGDPKGVKLSHHNIVSNIESTSQALDPVPTDRLMGVLPLFHSFGYTIILWLPLVVGLSAVLYPDPRQAKEISEFIKRRRCTLFVTTPTFLRFHIRRSEKDDFTSVRLLLTGAEKLPQAVAAEFGEKFGVAVMEGYGCTELSPVVSVNVQDWEEDGVKQIGHKPGTVGQPVPGEAAMVVDPAKLDGRLEPLPPNQEGLLLIYGPNVMVGYLNKDELTREAIRDGWYVTGDIAKIDDDGFITITDRLSRFSKVGGEMVPHQRVEDEIHLMLHTTDRVVAVTGVPDAKKGERLVVLHTPLNGVSADQVYQHLASTDLPNLWLPTPRNFFQVPELPLLGSGKLDLQRVNKVARELAVKDD